MSESEHEIKIKTGETVLYPKLKTRFPLGSRIGARLFLIGTLIVLFTGTVIAFVGVTTARQGLLDETERRILALVEERHAHLCDWLDLHIEHTKQHLLGNAGHLVDHQQWQQIVSEVPGLIAAAIFDSSGIELSENKSNPVADLIPDSSAFNEARHQHRMAFSTVGYFEDDVPAFDVVSPVDVSGSHDQYLVMRFSSRIILDPVLTDTAGLGQSGEIFLLDTDMRMLTPSRSHDHPDPLQHRMPIPPAMAALRQGHGSMQYTSFLGKSVVGAYHLMPLQQWIVVGELDVEEVLSPIRAIYDRTILLTALILLSLLILTLLLAHFWARPIVRLTEASQRVAAGDLSVRVDAKRARDEVATLSHSFNSMVESLADGQQNLANAQVKLVQQEKMAVIGRLVASVVHEMRNPLSAIKMNLRLLQRGAQLTENEKEHLEIAGGETQRLESMLQELLDYGKPVELDLRQVNISDIIVQILKETRSLAENGDVRVQFEQADNQPTIRTDPELLHRLLENLVLNAVQACRSGDTVSVEIEYSVEATSICVKDTGSGMTETVRKRLFDPFFTTREEGTGLGMSNVQKFVSVMGGTVSVESETGQGTKVTIHLPKENSWPNS